MSTVHGAKGRARKGSLFDKMSALAVGEAVYVECDSKSRCHTVQRTASTATRYPDNMKGCVYTTSAVLAVANPFTAYLLVRIERTA